MLVLAYDYETCAKSIFFVFPSLSLSYLSLELPAPSLPPICTHLLLLLPALACWLLYTLYRREERRGGLESHLVCQFFLVFVSDFDCSSLVAPFGQTRN